MSSERHFLRVENFDLMQNPKRPARPTWIKSFVRDLDDATWLGSSLAVRGFMGDFQKLAATKENRVPYDQRFIARKLGTSPALVGRMLRTCMALGWLTQFAEDAVTSRSNDLREKIATPSIPSSSSSSQSTSEPSTASDKTTGLRLVPDPDCVQCGGSGCGWCREAS